MKPVKPPKKEEIDTGKLVKLGLALLFLVVIVFGAAAFFIGLNHVPKTTTTTTTIKNPTEETPQPTDHNAGNITLPGGLSLPPIESWWTWLVLLLGLQAAFSLFKHRW